MGFYQDVYRTVSAQLLPGLRACLELCSGYIEGWMHDLKLQRMIKDSFVSDSPLGFGETHALTLVTVVCEGYKEGIQLGEPPQPLKDVTDAIGLQADDILINFALLIARRIQAVRPIGSISLQQEALRVLNDLKSTKFLVPLLILTYLTGAGRWGENFHWVKAEQNVINSLKDVVVDGGHYTKAATSRLPAEADTSAPEFAIAAHLHICQSEMVNDPERSMIVRTAPGQASSAETSTGTLGLHNGTAMPSVSPSPTLVQPGPQLPHVSIQAQSLVSPDHMDGFTHLAKLSWNTEPSVPQSLSPAQLSGNNVSHNWSSSPIMFSQPPSAARELQPFDNAPPQTRFSPITMTTPTPSFIPSLPQTPHPSHMPPPPRR